MTEKHLDFELHEARLCVNALIELSNDHVGNIEDHVRIQLGFRMPEMLEMIEEIREITTALGIVKNPNDVHISIPSGFLPWLKSALSAARTKEALIVESRSLKTKNPSALAKIREKLNLIESLVNDERFDGIESHRVPRLTDYLTIQQAEESLFRGGRISLLDRIFDEKFNILLSPTLVADDVQNLRIRCSLRDAPLSVGFVDIDDFKQFNTKYSEPVVDEIVLPSFMSLLEAHLFGRGHVYRQGGDEYLVICPNLTAEQSGQLFSDFQKKLDRLKLPGVSEKIGVSVGVCTASPECQLTDRELVRFASKAKDAAKKLGKKQVAGYTDPSPEQEPIKL